MNVTAQNFEEAFKEIESLLPEAEFVALDCEMTGINLEESGRNNYDETLQVSGQG